MILTYPFVFFSILAIVILLGGFPKLIVTSAVFIRRDELPLKKLLYVIAIESVIISSILFLSHFLIVEYVRLFGLQIVEVVLSISGPIALWFFKMHVRSYITFELFVVLLMLLPIYSIIAAFPNRKLLRHTSHENTLRVSKLRAFLLGLMMPGFIIIFIIAYLSMPIVIKHGYRKNNITISNKQGELNHLLIKASSFSLAVLGEKLITRGADVNAKDASGYSALYRAFYFGGALYGEPLEMVRLLLEKGADVNAKDEIGTTVLMMASGGHGRLEEYKLLLAKDPDVNARDKYGMTALMKASSRNQLEKVKLLLGKGADVNAKDKGGKTALSFASTKRHVPVRDLLISHGAKE